MSVQVHFDNRSCALEVPGRIAFLGWVKGALNGHVEHADLAIRVVDEDESRESNLLFRGVDHATNVLSFPLGLPPGVPATALGNPLGDLLICAPVVIREAGQQGKSAEAHFAHMAVHGVLHLLGHDHQQPDEAEVMEALETRIMGHLHYADPYQPQGQCHG